MEVKNSICAVIPAAGEGRRLGHSLPKILVPVTPEKTVWEILHGKLSVLVDHTHVILSDKGSRLFQRKFPFTGAAKNVSTSIQQAPRGMGDAIFGAYEHWKNFNHILIIWGDQVNVSPQTLQSVIQSQKDSLEETLTLPINMVSNPYVQYDFNKDHSALLNIRQSREGDICDKKGFADVGVFCLSTNSLMKSWQKYLQKPILGEQTGEINFLPFLVYLSIELQWCLKLVEVKDPLESRGINTEEDLKFFREKFS
jgi:bifunctional UDP-N-acetylglucosamine pyrophosphorylase/glucosamine-1-phosphate N-acetyltransferase